MQNQFDIVREQQQHKEMSQDIYCEDFDEKKLKGIAQYFQAVFENPEPMASEIQILTQELNSPRQKVIQMDCLRTRSQIFSQQIKQQMERMLTHYVRVTNMQYKQGLNQIAAPFIYLRRAGVPINKCQIYFHKFFTSYCLNFYDDSDFNSIQLFVKMFSIVLKYHDPALHRYLNWYNVQPQIFCIGWLMTLFASKVSLQMVYTLWLFIATQKDKFLLFFLVLGIVLANKQNIIQTKNAHILTTVTNLIFKNQKELEVTIQRSLLLRKNTPNSLVKFFRDRIIFERRKNFSDIYVLVSHLEKFGYFIILPSEMALEKHIKKGLCQQECYLCDLSKPIVFPQIEQNQISQRLRKFVNISNDIRNMKFVKQFVIVDLRKDQSELINYSGQVFKVNIKNEIQETQEHFLGKFIEQKSRKHFVFMLSQFNFESLESCDQDELTCCKNLLNSLVSFSFPLLGVLQGGFSAFLGNQATQQLVVSQTEHQQILPEEDNKCIFLKQNKKYPHIFPLKISDRAILGNRLSQSRYIVSIGKLEAMIIFDNILMIVPRDKQIESFHNFFRHSNSVMSYLYQHPNSPKQFETTKVLSLKKLKKASMKIHNQNILVLCYQSCKHTQFQIFNQFTDLLNFSIRDLLYLEKNCQKCTKKKNKIYLQMQSHEKVQDCVNVLTHKYAEMNNKLKLIKQQMY